MTLYIQSRRIWARAGTTSSVRGVLSPNPKHTPQPVTEAPSQPKVTATRKTARSQKDKPKSTAATKPAAGKPKKKAASVKNAAAKPTTSELVVPTKSPTSPLEDI
jgi:hypothetical protein